MELYKEIVARALARGEIQVTFSGQEPDISKVAEDTCYKALKKIKAIIEDDSQNDKECFMKIEEIVCVLEEIGTNGVNRHDFG